jgi:hypothetical protein
MKLVTSDVTVVILKNTWTLADGRAPGGNDRRLDEIFPNVLILWSDVDRAEANP